jgi:hypothetical protein
MKNVIGLDLGNVGAWRPFAAKSFNGKGREGTAKDAKETRATAQLRAGGEAASI